MHHFTLLLISLLSAHVYAVYSPVVIVPGIGGNQIEAKLHQKPKKPAWYCSTDTNSYFTLWLDMTALIPFKINCWADNIRLEWDMEKMTVSNPRGVLTRVPGFGDTSTMETMDKKGMFIYMKPLVDYLTGLGYRKGKDLHGATYDFRYSPENLPDNFEGKLKAMIEEMYTSSINEPVTLISHSYGCIVTQYFLSQQTKEWKKKYIKQWIPLAGPFGGIKRNVCLYSSGYVEGYFHLIVNLLTMRKEQRSSTSNLWMLPSRTAWPANEVIAKTHHRTYTVADMDDFLHDVGFPEGVRMRRHITNSSELMSKAPGVPVYCFHGHTYASTIDHVEFGWYGFPDSPIRSVMGDGDGTVNIPSLRLCKKLAGLQVEEVKVTELPGVTHSSILGNKKVLDAIGKLIE